ncbi:MAG TPA: hypothetical protein VM677_13780 [Actinokineospora sp.]|nr:hypothetical protein [Actinokineospora sp.]
MLWLIAWSVGGIGAESLAGRERGARCDGTLMPSGAEIALTWATPVLFGIASAALILLIRAERARLWRSPNAIAALCVLVVVVWVQVMVSQRVVDELVGAIPHVQVCGG